MKETWELTDCPEAAVKIIRERWALFVERLDDHTINVDVSPEDEDALVEFCEAQGIELKLL